jgi:stearoyl-CoA desaturase (delta-9 desaturase)
VQFHATTLGVNVFGHLETPKWFTILLALLTGGEALHVHHHEFPKSALHLPKNGFWNRIIDYNGTFLLILSKLRLARNLIVAPQFA